MIDSPYAENDRHDRQPIYTRPVIEQLKALIYQRGLDGSTRDFVMTRSDPMKLISVVTGCFNEEDNVDALYARIRAQFERLPAYDYEHIFIDNASTDGTVARSRRSPRWTSASS
jgi:hypothetical protein